VKEFVEERERVGTLSCSARRSLSAVSDREASRESIWDWRSAMRLSLSAIWVRSVDSSDSRALTRVDRAMEVILRATSSWWKGSDGSTCIISSGRSKFALPPDSAAIAGVTLPPLFLFLILILLLYVFVFLGFGSFCLFCLLCVSDMIWCVPWEHRGDAWMGRSNSKYFFNLFYLTVNNLIFLVTKYVVLQGWRMDRIGTRDKRYKMPNPYFIINVHNGAEWDLGMKKIRK